VGLVAVALALVAERVLGLSLLKVAICTDINQTVGGYYSLRMK